MTWHAEVSHDRQGNYRLDRCKHNLLRTCGHRGLDDNARCWTV